MLSMIPTAAILSYYVRHSAVLVHSVDRQLSVSTSVDLCRALSSAVDCYRLLSSAADRCRALSTVIDRCRLLSSAVDHYRSLSITIDRCRRLSIEKGRHAELLMKNVVGDEEDEKNVKTSRAPPRLCPISLAKIIRGDNVENIVLYTNSYTWNITNKPITRHDNKESAIPYRSQNQRWKMTIPSSKITRI